LDYVVLLRRGYSKGEGVQDKVAKNVMQLARYRSEICCSIERFLCRDAQMGRWRDTLYVDWGDLYSFNYFYTYKNYRHVFLAKGDEICRNG